MMPSRHKHNSYQRARICGMRPFLLRIPEDMWKQLEAAAKDGRMSRHAKVLEYIEWGLENDYEIKLRK